MTIYISLLRGINVSGQKKIKMADLKALYQALGLDNVKTYIQSGNVVFESGEASLVLSQKIHEAIEENYGFSVPIEIRSLNDWQAIVAGNPFTPDNKESKYFHVTLLGEIPDEQLVHEVDKLDFGSDEYHVLGNVVYLYCPNGYGRTKLNNNFWERKLKVTATTRNWKTVNKLLELAEAIGTS
jgi:uncharacterized protein (DUF1697 family)